MSALLASLVCVGLRSQLIVRACACVRAVFHCVHTATTTSGYEPRITELDQPVQQLYSLDDDQWFMNGTHPITRSIW